MLIIVMKPVLCTSPRTGGLMRHKTTEEGAKLRVGRLRARHSKGEGGHNTRITWPTPLRCCYAARLLGPDAESQNDQ